MPNPRHSTRTRSGSVEYPWSTNQEPTGRATIATHGSIDPYSAIHGQLARYQSIVRSR